MNRSIHMILASGMLLAGATFAAAQETGYPEVCRSDMKPAAPMADHAMHGMKDYQKAAMPGMDRMNADMMQGMMKDDADVAFVCGMIAHHQGAIDMSKVELEYGDDKWAKQMAQKVIDAQMKEIAGMTTWLKDNAK